MSFCIKHWSKQVLGYKIYLCYPLFYLLCTAVCKHLAVQQSSAQTCHVRWVCKLVCKWNSRQPIDSDESSHTLAVGESIGQQHWSAECTVLTFLLYLSCSSAFCPGCVMSHGKGLASWVAYADHVLAYCLTNIGICTEEWENDSRCSIDFDGVHLSACKAVAFVLCRNCCRKECSFSF